ncbi:DUF6263 family protein [Elizabethkingia meningoseptica]|uniref:DUF6263 family protein n=1 Tax=Elizabethkingia meningoseptica TaxID=238 RepID=UPI0023B01B30|nr:DUF6263 family protein [Elizabethkingia meningoseptica]MDE5526596.1 hypothetical protein [Elizabethkingia meningoseptica]
MKKVLAFAAISLSLIACKKEGKTTETKTENNKTETSASGTSTSEVKEEIKPAISDSLGVYKLKYKLEKGKTYPFVLSQKDVQSMTMGDKSQSNTNETTDNITFTVTNFDKGIYDMDVHFISKKQVGNTQGQSISVDTDGAEPKNENLKIFWKVNKALMGNTLKMKMNESGNIISFEGFDPIYAKVTTAVNGAVKDANQRKALIEGFKQGFSDNALKAQFKANINLFPEKGLKIGQSFSESANLSPDGKLKSTTTFTLAKVENGIAEITVKGGVPKKSDKQSQNGVTQTVSLQAVQSGSLKLDTQTGWMKTSALTMTSTQSQTLSDGKQTQTATQKNVSTTKINP